MPNIKLNVGGLIGALAFGATATAILFAFDFEVGRVARFGVGELVLGAFAGNFGWALVFPGRDTEDERDGSKSKRKRPSAEKEATNARTRGRNRRGDEDEE